jgi:IS1 family transposase
MYKKKYKVSAAIEVNEKKLLWLDIHEIYESLPDDFCFELHRLFKGLDVKIYADGEFKYLKFFFDKYEICFKRYGENFGITNLIEGFFTCLRHFCCFMRRRSICCIHSLEMARYKLFIFMYAWNSGKLLYV